MHFGEPLMLLLAIPFLLLFFSLGKLERRRFLLSPSNECGSRSLLLWLATRKVPKYLWLFVSLASIIVLASPIRLVGKEGIEVQGRIKCISLDLSFSMREKNRSKTGRSSFEVIKEVTVPFVEKRATTDFITVTVYGGKNKGLSGGDATILVRPTQNAEFIKKQIKSIDPGMVGIYTSIGEGVFTCLSSMLDQEFEKHSVDRFLLREGLEEENWSYPISVSKKIGRMRHMIIVLFTDGVNNAGIEPLTMVEFARMLGIKIYFSVLESTGGTGYSSTSEELELRNDLKNAVRATGGFAFETKTVEDVEKHYNEIDKFESAKVRVFSKESLSSEWRFWLGLVIFGFILFSLFEILFLKAP